MQNAAKTIGIGRDVYEIKLSDCDVHAEGREILAKCLLLDITDKNAVAEMLEKSAALVDRAFGNGTMRRIADGKPVGFGDVLAVINPLVDECGRRYEGYVAREYLPKESAEPLSAFSLSGAGSFPTACRADGREYKIRCDHRTILRIFRMLGDPEIADNDKPILLKKMFFDGPVPNGADEIFQRFVSMGRERGEPGGERDFDYEQDASEIYSAFVKEYGIDLIEGEPLHWWRFCALLEGVFCGENALSSKVRMRHIDDNKTKRESALSRQKKAVKLKRNIGRTEEAIGDELRERLLRGEPINDLIKGG